MNKTKIMQGDILLLSDGRMLEVISNDTRQYSGYHILQFIDRDEYSHVDLERLQVESNLGQLPAVKAAFYAGRSVHLRLNRMNKV